MNTLRLRSDDLAFASFGSMWDKVAVFLKTIT